MLWITIHTHPTCLTLQLEGKLAGPWVGELAACWQRTVADQGRPVDRVDLAALTSLDAAGKELLAAMHAPGRRTRGRGLPDEGHCGGDHRRISSSGRSAPLREVLVMLAHLIILDLCVCLTAMLFGRFLDAVRARLAATS
jgi:hypothetical protein